MMTLEVEGVKKRFEDFCLYALSTHVVPFGSVAHNTLAIPGRPGALLINQEINPIAFAVELNMVENDEIRAIGKINDLIGYLFDDRAKAREIRVQMDYEPDKYRKAYVSGDVSSVRANVQNSLPLNFICYDPYKYSVVNNDEILWGSTVVDFRSTAYMLGHINPSADFIVTGNTTIPITVMGLALQPVIELEGSATNLIIENNGQRINVGTFASAKWEIDTGKFIAYKNSIETMLDMGIFILNRGQNNVKFTGTNMNLTVTIRFKDRWK